MNKVCTSIEQSKKLMELGVDINTADMSYSSIHNIGQEVSYCNVPLCICPMADDTPAWSLTALLGLFDDKAGIAKEYDGTWFAYDNGKSHCGKYFDNPLDAAFQMVVWLKENGKIKI